MKLLIMFLLFGYTAKANNYYVKNGGSDLAAGTSNGTAWATPTKAAATAVSGDSVFFNRGDSWNSQFKPAASNIYVGAYGTGNKPTFTGFQEATGWTDSSHVWSATISNSVAYQNMIMMDGKPRAKGRYPNSTYLTATVTSQSTFNMLQVAPFDFSGGEVAFQNYPWIVDACKVTSVSALTAGGTVTLQNPLTYNANWGNNAWFIQNHVNCLDQPYEWCYDSASKRLRIYSLDTPRNVFYSSIDTLVSNHNISNVTYDGIKITGANRINFSADTNHFITLKNSTISNSGMNGVHLNKSIKTTLQNDSIDYSLNDGIYMRWPCDSSWIDGNVITNSGTYFGMNLSGEAAKQGIFGYGNVIKYSYNRIINSGYNALTFFAGAANAKDSIYRNYIDTFCLTASDGGGIYTNVNTGSQTGSLIKGNIIRNGIGFNGSAVGGVYLDNSSTGITIDSNTVENIFGTVFTTTFSGGGIIINGGTNITVKNNNIVNDRGICYWTSNGIALSNVTTTNNKFYSKLRTQPIVYSGVLNGTITQDSNYVLRSNASDSIFHNGSNGYYGLAAWQSATSKDAHSIEIFPSGIESAASGTLYYNATQNGTLTNINGRNVDEAGNVYTNSITLQPFTSKILWRTTVQPTVIHSIGNLIFE